MIPGGSDPRREAELSDLAASLDAVVDHAAVAARRIRDLLPLYQDLLGGVFHVGGDNLRVGYRGVQLRYRDGTRFELLEPLGGSAFLDSFFRKHPHGGMHHVTFRVPAMADALAVLRGRGYAVTGAYSEDAHWQEVFLHPREAFGTLVQIAVAGPGYGPVPGLTLDDVLSGHGQPIGSGVPSP